MGELKFRVDSRLIHGQVVARWTGKWQLSRIMIVDGPLSIDEFMRDIYLMAAPQGVTVDIVAPDAAKAALDAGGLNVGNTLILFKDLEHAAMLHDTGFPIGELQIGSLPSGPGKSLVYKTIALGESDWQVLDRLAEAGMRIYFQMLPEESPWPYEKARH
jgi:mannose/fructose/N-acetylgalactosamine-specific phosphotransferase system component IIB